MNSLFLAAVVLLSSVATADQRGPPDLKKVAPFDGFDFAPYDHFWDSWHLVTTRYRIDKEEQRFIYANPITWKAIQRRAAKYPDGSVFGKVAFGVKFDPLFPVSAEPASFTRIQLMKKDAKKYSKSGGWVYALYPNENPSGNAEGHEACYACHQLAAARDFVFSAPAFMKRASHHADDANLFRERFKETPFANLPRFGKNAITSLMKKTGGPSPAKVQMCMMPVFGGSVDESIPVVVLFALKDQTPFLLIDPHKPIALAVFPLPATAACKQKAWVARLDGSKNVYGSEYCDGKLSAI